MGYKKEEINRLANEFANGNDESFNNLLTNHLTEIIGIQLAKNYKGYPYWDDLKQEVLLYLWQKKESIRKSIKKSKMSPSNYLWGFIRSRLKEIIDKINTSPSGLTDLRRSEFDEDREATKKTKAEDIDVVGFDDLTGNEKRELGVETDEDDWD